MLHLLYVEYNIEYILICDSDMQLKPTKQYGIFCFSKNLLKIDIQT